MALTPSDVEQKTFSTALRGYDLDEVDDFLDEVVSTIRDLQEQVADNRTAQPPADTTASAESAPADSESAVGRVLITAQTTADTIVSDARDEANRILEEAKEEADSWSTERDAKKAEADAEMSELAGHVTGVRTQLAILATAVADRLDEMDIAIGGDDADELDDDIEDGQHETGGESTSYVADDTAGEEAGSGPDDEGVSGDSYDSDDDEASEDDEDARDDDAGDESSYD